MKTWKQKIGKCLMRHVANTTQRSTLAEVRRNLAAQAGNPCTECAEIARKLKRGRK